MGAVRGLAGIAPVSIDERHVQMEPRPLVVVERLAHERRDQPVAGRQLLDHRPEAERAVGGVERLGVAQVDLELAAAVLVGGGDRPELELDRCVEHPRERASRVGHVADRVNRAVLARVRTVPARRARVRLAQVELELGPDHRRDAELRELGEDALERPAAVERMGLVRDRVLEIDQAGDDVLLPRQRHHRGEVRAREEIREAALEARDHVVAQVDGHDRLDEPHPLLGHVRERRDRDQLAAADAVEVGVLQAHGADADFGQLGQAAHQPDPRGGGTLTGLFGHLSLLSLIGAQSGLSSASAPAWH